MKFCVTGGFFEKKNSPKMTQNGPKAVFFEFVVKFGNHFFLKLVYDASLFYMLHSFTNPFSWKNHVP